MSRIAVAIALPLAAASPALADSERPRLAEMQGYWSLDGKRKEPVFGVESMISVTRGPALQTGYNLVEVDRTGGLLVDGRRFQLNSAARVGMMGSCHKSTRLKIHGVPREAEAGRIAVDVAAGTEVVTYDASCDASKAKQRDFAGQQVVFELRRSDGQTTLRMVEPGTDFLFGARMTRR